MTDLDWRLKKGYTGTSVNCDAVHFHELTVGKLKIGLCGIVAKFSLKFGQNLGNGPEKVQTASSAFLWAAHTERGKLKIDMCAALCIVWLSWKSLRLEVVSRVGPTIVQCSCSNVQMFKCNCSCSEAFLHKQLLCKRTELGEMHHLYQFCSVVKRSLVRFQATDSYSEKPMIRFRWKHNKGQLCYSCPYLWVSFHWWTCSQEVQTLDSWLEQVRTDAQLECFLPFQFELMNSPTSNKYCSDWVSF